MKPEDSQKTQKCLGVSINMFYLQTAHVAGGSYESAHLEEL